MLSRLEGEQLDVAAVPVRDDLDVLAPEVGVEQPLAGRDAGDASARELGDDLGFRLGDPLDGSEELEVRRADLRDHGDLGPGDAAQLAHLAQPPRSHLRDDDLGVGLDPGERQRQADLVVVALLGRDRAAVRPAESGQDVLRRRLAGGARDRHHPGVRAVAHRAPERRHRRVLVLRHERGGGAVRQRVVHEVDAAPDRDEQVARADPARVDLEAGRLCRAAREPPAFRGTGAPRPRAQSGSRGRPLEKATERVPRLLDVREGDGAIGEGLALLVPLAGDHDDVAVGCVPDGGADGRAPIGLHLDLGATPGAGEDLLDDGLRLLRARVVGGHDEHVRQLPGGPSHERALGAVAVAAAAEDAHEPTLRDLPRRAKDVRERVRGVGIVHEHRERLALLDRLEAAGNACDMRDAAHDRIVGQLEEPPGRDGAEDVLDVEAAAQARPAREPRGREARSAGVQLERFGPDVRLVHQPERDELRSGRPQLLGQAASVRIAER